jgi:hypothetical protein
MKGYYQRSKTRAIQDAICAIFAEQRPPLTIRQIFYALTTKGVLPKIEKSYRKTCYQLKRMRESGAVAYGWIADNTRWFIKPSTERSLGQALSNWQKAYRRDIWSTQPVHVEIWVEKDALTGVLSPVTEEFDVPLYVCRGYSSSTFLYEAAEEIKRIGKPAYVYYFGDLDPSGVDAAEHVRDGLIKHGAQVHFTRAAVTEEQVKKLNLPTRETKPADPRSSRWGNKPSAELDALPAPILRALVRECIERHIDPDLLAMALLIEKRERETLAQIRMNFVPVHNSDGLARGNQEAWGSLGGRDE